MSQFRFTMYQRPVGKERPRVDRRTGRIYTPPSTVREERAFAKACRHAMRGRAKFTGPVKLNVLCVFETPASWPKYLKLRAQEGKVWHVAKGQLDLDNAIKLVNDALNTVAFEDDAQVAVITSGKRYGSPARVEVTVEELEQEIGAETPGQLRLERKIADAQEQAGRHARAARANSFNTKSRA